MIVSNGNLVKKLDVKLLVFMPLDKALMMMRA